MKAKCVNIKIQPLAADMEDFLRVTRAIQRGHPPARLTDVLTFGSLETMRMVLTPRRMELLQTIRSERPASIYALAKTIGRDLRNVQDDVAFLARLGLVSLKPGRHPRAGVSPRVEYDRIRLEIPLTRRPPAKKPGLTGLVGALKGGPKNLAEDHDHYLYGSPRKSRRKP